MFSFRNSAKDLRQTPMAHGPRGSQSGREKIRLRVGSLFSWSIEQNARDTQMTTRVTEGARRPPRCLAASPLNAPVRALPSLNLKKKRNCSQARKKGAV